MDTDTSEEIERVIKSCFGESMGVIWIVVFGLIMVFGLISNLALAWLFVRERKDLSPSQAEVTFLVSSTIALFIKLIPVFVLQCLGVNLVVMDLLYLLLVPVILTGAINATERNVTINVMHLNGTMESNSNGGVDIDVICIINVIGCPLLLACMCLERYMAVARPVMYLRMRRWAYKIAVSAVVWAFTLTYCLVTVLLGGLPKMYFTNAIITCILFLLMLYSLGGMAWSLWQLGPAHSQAKPLPSPPLKRQALGNVMVVFLPAVVAYLPVVCLIPFMYQNANQTDFSCDIINIVMFFPNFGVFIGPLFYMAKARQICRNVGGRRPAG